MGSSTPSSCSKSMSRPTLKSLSPAEAKTGSVAARCAALLCDWGKRCRVDGTYLHRSVRSPDRCWTTAASRSPPRPCCSRACSKYQTDVETTDSERDRARRTARSVHPRVQARAFLQACETEFDEWRCRRRWGRGPEVRQLYSAVAGPGTIVCNLR